MSQKIKDKLQQLQEQRRKIDGQIIKVRNSCLHEEWEDKKEYSSGGYDYVACTTYYKLCKFCKKTVELKTEYHAGQYT